MNEYTFPFNTCEKTKEGIMAQPYSVVLNLINCLIIFYFLLRTRKTYTFLLLFFLFCFELFHSFSHVVHINSSIQINIIHFITYLINVAFLNVFYCYTNVFPTMEFMLYLGILICFDLYSIFNLTIIYYLLSQSILFISILLYYYPLLPKFIQKSIYQIIPLVGLIILLFLNEKYNCKKMLDVYPFFPYHIFIEITGILLFYIIASHFSRL
jgi:hypothetical protein